MTNNKNVNLKVEIPEAKWSSVNEYCDTIVKLRNGIHENYRSRQTYEWKMCITIWSYIVAVTGILLTKPNISIGIGYHLIASFIIGLIHLVWQSNLRKSNDLDMDKIKDYEKEIEKFVDIEKNRNREGLFIFSNWSHIIYVVITAVLLITSVYVVHNQKQNNINLPKDIQARLKSKHFVSVQEKEKYIITILRNEMDSERTANQTNSADAKGRATD